MEDLEIAKEELKEKKLGLVIVKSGKIIFRTSGYGVLGLIKAIDDFGEGLREASAADTVVGRAAAMLCSYASFKEVYAGLMSRGGLEVLGSAGIRSEHGKLVPVILNRTRADVCPFEKLVSDSNSGRDCYERIKKFFSK